MRASSPSSAQSSCSIARLPCRRGFLLQPVNLALERRPLAVVPEQLAAPGRTHRPAAGRAGSAAMPVTSCASYSFRRSKSADGTLSGWRSCRLAPASRISPRRQPLQILGLRSVVERRQRLGRLVHQRPDRPRSAGLSVAERRQLPASVSIGLARHRRLADLGPHHLFGNACLVGQPVARTGRGRRRRGSGPPPPASRAGTPAGPRPCPDRALRPPGRAGIPDTAASCRSRSWYASRPVAAGRTCPDPRPVGSSATLTRTLRPPAARTTAPPRPGRRRRDRSSARPST